MSPPLWPHQRQALESLNAAIADGQRRICITCPTGGGKTRILAEHMTQGRYQSSVYVYRRMLLSQLSDVLSSQGVVHGLRAAGEPERLLEPIQLCSTQTEVSRVLNGDRDIHPADKVYIDEAHQQSADTMQGLCAEHEAANPDVIRIGLTATPLGIDHFYDTLIVAGRNSELRDCGALLLAHHFGPDEPDTKWIGTVTTDGGECGIKQQKRLAYAKRVFGSIIEHYEEYNPEYRPAICFAPDVKSSIWLAEEFTHNGIRAAHIDGENIWLDGGLEGNTPEVREHIAVEHRRGNIRVVCNRFVLREGIDWPWVYHGIFATVFGSLTSYIQAGGRLLRNHESMDHVVIQDHGGNWWRHGSLNADREWHLAHNDRIASGLRADRIRNGEEREPIQCPKCHAVRMKGPKCWECGFQYTSKSRKVLQKDGTLREMKGDIFRARRVAPESEKIKSAWCGYIAGIRKSKKESVRAMTFAQAEANFARRNNWKYPPRTLPMMPVDRLDWYRPVVSVEHLT